MRDIRATKNAEPQFRSCRKIAVDFRNTGWQAKNWLLEVSHLLA